MIISDFIDADALSTNEIIDNFCQYCNSMDGTKITFEIRKKLQTLLDKEPLLRILSRAMYNQGYDSF